MLLFSQILLEQAFASDLELVPVYRFADMQESLEICELPDHTLPPERQSGWVLDEKVAPKDWELVGVCGPGNGALAWKKRLTYNVLYAADSPPSATRNMLVTLDDKPIECSKDYIHTVGKKPGLFYLWVRDHLMVTTQYTEDKAFPNEEYHVDYRLAQSVRSFKSSGLSARDFVFRRSKGHNNSKVGLYTPSPSKIGFRVRIPENASLEFYYGLTVEKQLGKSDGARFEVRWQPKQGKPEQLWTDSVGPGHRVKPLYQWHWASIDFNEFAGQSGTLIFATYPNMGAESSKSGEINSPNRYFDYACWGHPILYRRSAKPRKWNNVVLLVCDALRGDNLGYTGYWREGISPFLDQLANQGVVYTHCCSQAPWTPPSFATIFTGCYPSTHGVSGYKGKKIPPQLCTLAEVLHDKGYATFGVANNGNVTKAFGMRQGYETYVYPGEGDDLSVNHTIPFLHKNKDRPFLLFLHFNNTHRDFVGYEAYRYKFFDKKPEIDPLSIALRLQPKEILEAADEQLVRKQVRAIYDGSVNFDDDQIKRLWDNLASLNVLDHTLFVFTSDHGEEFWDRGGFGHGHSLHKELLHVPLFFVHDSLPRRKVNRIVTHVDLAPTILSFLDIEYRPYLRAADGQDLHIARPSPEEEEFVTNRDFIASVRQMDCLYSGTMKLISRDLKPVALYDLEKDFEETKNLHTEQPEVAKQMNEKLKSIREHSEKVYTSIVGDDIPADVQLDEEILDDLANIGYLD